MGGAKREIATKVRCPHQHTYCSVLVSQLCHSLYIDIDFYLLLCILLLGLCLPVSVSPPRRQLICKCHCVLCLCASPASQNQMPIFVFFCVLLRSPPPCPSLRLFNCVLRLCQCIYLLATSLSLCLSVFLTLTPSMPT